MIGKKETKKEKKAAKLASQAEPDPDEESTKSSGLDFSGILGLKTKAKNVSKT